MKEEPSTSSSTEKYRFDPDHDLLGQGKQGRVFRCQERFSGRTFALKVVPLDGPRALLEAEVMAKLHHPNCAFLEAVFEENNELYLVEEYCPGQPLQRYVSQRKEQKMFSEAEAQLLTRQILRALQHMHEECQLVHGDLKPDNILVVTINGVPVIKLIDFGLSSSPEPQEQQDGGKILMKCEVSERELIASDFVQMTRVSSGTPTHMAYESLECLLKCADSGGSAVLENTRQNLQKTDLFSLGLILFLMLSGQPPVGEGASSFKELHHHMSHPSFPRFSRALWSGVSKEAQSFVGELLQVQPEARLSAADALAHPWLAG